MNDILRTRIQEHKVKTLNREITAFRSKDIVKTGARVFTKNGLVASAAQVGEVEESTLFAKCEQNLDLALPEEAIPRGASKRNWNIASAKNSGSELALDCAEKQMEIFARELPNFVVQGQINFAKKSAHYTNHLGADLKSEFEELSYLHDLRRKGSANITDGFIFHTDLGSLPPPEDIRWTVEQFQTFDHEVKIKPGRHKVLMVPSWVALEKLGESLSADSYAEGTALYSNRMGEKIFSDKLTLSDLRNTPLRSWFSPFDFEGNVAANEKTLLVENGVLKSVVSDLKNEKRHGFKSTANGFRDFKSSVRLGFSKLAVEPGTRSFREILKDAGEVIICSMAFGGDLTAQGDFSTPIQLAFWAKDGQVKGKLPALSMTSHLEKMFGTELLEVAATGPFLRAPEPYLLCEMDIQLMS